MTNLRTVFAYTTLLLYPLLSACAQMPQPAQEVALGGETMVSQAIALPATPQSWDYRIAKVITSSAQQVVNQDAWDASVSSIAALHSAGKKVICYFSAGTWEYDNGGRGIINRALTDRNSDGVINGSGNTTEAAAVSAAIKAKKTSYVYGGQTLSLSNDQRTFAALAGQTLPGWPEYVYNIGGFTAGNTAAKFKLLRALMAGHMQRAKDLGCDGLEPDNIDAYANVTGGITATDQYRYNVWLAQTAHNMGLVIFLKNDLDQIANTGTGVLNGQGLVNFYDGLVNEECFDYVECSKAKPFTDQRKPIFVRMYEKTETCAAYRGGGYVDLDGNGPGDADEGKTRQAIANKYHLNVSVSGYANGGNPDANANAPKCTFGTW